MHSSIYLHGNSLLAAKNLAAATGYLVNESTGE